MNKLLLIILILLSMHAALANTTAPAPLDLNHATAQQLLGKVKGLGKKRCENIVKHRQKHGAYRSVDDLSKVKGIGKAFVNRYRNALKSAFTVAGR